MGKEGPVKIEKDTSKVNEMFPFFKSRIWSRRTTRAEKSAEQNGIIEYKRDTIGLGRKKLKFRQLQRKDLILRALHRNIFTMPFLLPKP